MSEVIESAAATTRPTYQPSDLLDTKQAAKYVRRSPSLLNKLRLKGGGPVFYQQGRLVNYRTRDLDRWIDEGRKLSVIDTPAKRPAKGRKAKSRR